MQWVHSTQWFLVHLLVYFIGLVTEYYTSGEFNPVKKVALAGKTGPATNIIAGIAVGMYSCVPPIPSYLCWYLLR